jgi:hypothetical protein
MQEMLDIVLDYAGDHRFHFTVDASPWYRSTIISQNSKFTPRWYGLSISIWWLTRSNAFWLSSVVINSISFAVMLEQTSLSIRAVLGYNSWSISGTCVNGEMEWRHQPQLFHKPGSSSRGCSLNSSVQTILKRATQWSGKSQH